MNAQKVKVGVIGCGNISPAYFSINQRHRFFDIVACADLNQELAQSRADEYSVPKVCSADDIMADSEIETILNLTIPAAHGPVAIQALEAGKNVYNEKPLAVSREEAKKMLDLAREKNLRVGCAPDTFMGAGIQTCRKLIDDGWIGQPISANAFMMGGGGVENWHPNPDFFFKAGGGPMFDMGPYYLTMLVSLLGPVKRLSGAAQIGFKERTIRKADSPRFGEKIHVEVPTHIASVLEFQSGPTVTLITSWETHGAPFPNGIIFGTEGTLMLPDPNTFGGPVKLLRHDATDWQEVPLPFSYAENSRGIGLADMASAQRSGRPHRASGEMAYHVLDLMHSTHEAAREGRYMELQSTCERPAPLPLGLREGEID